MNGYFDTMEEEFHKLIGQINNNLDNKLNQGKEHKESVISEAQSRLNDAESCIKQMEIEINPLPESQRRGLQQKVKKCRQEFDDTRRKLMNVEGVQTLQSQKRDLMGSRADDIEVGFMAPDSLLGSQNRRLEQAKGTAYESLDIAGKTQEALYGQTAVLRRNINRTSEIDDNMSWSNKMIGQMNRRIRQNKILLYLVFCIIGLACVGIIASYFR